MLFRHRRDLLLSALVAILGAGISGGIMTGLFFLLAAVVDIAGAWAVPFKLAAVLVTMIVMSVGILMACCVLFLSGFMLRDIPSDISRDRRGR